MTGIAGERALLGDVADALLDARPELARHGPADDLRREFDAAARDSARSRATRGRTGRGRRSASCAGPRTCVLLRIVSRYGMRGGMRDDRRAELALEPLDGDRDLVLALRPQQLLAGLRAGARRGGSGLPRAAASRAAPSLSRSALVCGSMATGSVGSGKSIGAICQRLLARRTASRR